MPHRARLLCLTVLAAVLAGGCAHVPGQKQMLSDLTDEIGRTYAPDRRTALWETQVQKQGGELILTGLTDRPEALEALRTAAAREDLDARIDVRLLPDASVSEKPWALVSVPAASLTGKPAFAAALTTQAVLGTPLRVLERQRPFTRVQTPDGYIGWVHDLQIVRLTQEKLAERNTAKRVIVPRGPMLLLDEKGSALMPVPAAAELVELGREKGRVRVLLPDGCTGTLASDQVVPTEAFEKHWDALRRGPEAVYAQAFVEMARAFLGTPYLWGGTSQAGLDCSGFVSLARRLTGLIVSRDADQQLAQARPYKFDRIEDVPPGLLLGFGKKLEDGKLRVDHIAVSLGGGDFIHSLGSVRIESLSEASPLYSAYEAGRFLGVWELPASLTGVPCATTLSSNPFYAAKPGALEPCRAPAVLDQ